MKGKKFAKNQSLLFITFINMNPVENEIILNKVPKKIWKK